jgi:hypothetical protein
MPSRPVAFRPILTDGLALSVNRSIAKWKTKSNKIKLGFPTKRPDFLSRFALMGLNIQLQEGRHGKKKPFAKCINGDLLGFNGLPKGQISATDAASVAPKKGVGFSPRHNPNASPRYFISLYSFTSIVLLPPSSVTVPFTSTFLSVIFISSLPLSLAAMA